MPVQTARDHLMASLSVYGRVGRELALALGELVFLYQGRRGEVLVEKGRRQQVVWFMHLGTAKQSTIEPCSQAMSVSWFWYSSDFIFSYPGFFAGERASAPVELLEDSELLGISYSDFMGLMEGFAEMPQLVEKIRAQDEKSRAEHAADLVGLSARERYKKFFARHRALFNVAKHKDIASFLGIRSDGFHRYR